MLFNTRKLKKPGLSTNRPSNNWALGSILLRRRIKKYPDFASTRFWIHRVFETFHSGERIQKVADSYAGFTGYVWTEAVSCGFKNIRICVDGALKTWFD